MNITGKSFDMLISTLYSDRVMAVVREYGTNAYEAHQYDGIESTPFYVHSPTTQNPMFIVRDFGPGMSRDKISLEYTTLFQSDKDLSNKYGGGFGIGAKCGLCYAEKYTTISYYEGKKNTYKCYRGSDGIPVMDLVKVEDTQESGLEVRINVSTNDIGRFCLAISNCYKYFRTIPNVDNCEVKKYESTLQELGTEEYSFIKSYHNKAICRIGNITYPLGPNFPNGILVEIPIGDTTIDSSRESLSMDSKTIKYLNELSIRISKEIKSKIQSLINKCLCAYDTMQLYSKYHSIYNVDLFYKDAKITNHLRHLKYSKVREYSYGKLSQPSDRCFLSKDCIFIIRDCSSDARRIKQYCINHDIKQSTCLTIDKENIENAILEVGITKSHLIKLSDMPLPKIKRSGIVKSHTISVYLVNNSSQTDIDKKSVSGFYIEKDNFKLYVNHRDISRFEILEMAKALNITDNIYAVTKSQLKSIKSTNFKNFYEENKDRIKNLVNSKYMIDYTNQNALLIAIRKCSLGVFINDLKISNLKSTIPQIDNIKLLHCPKSYSSIMIFLDMVDSSLLLNDVSIIEEVYAKYPLLRHYPRFSNEVGVLNEFLDYIKEKNETNTNTV